MPLRCLAGAVFSPKIATLGGAWPAKVSKSDGRVAKSGDLWVHPCVAPPAPPAPKVTSSTAARSLPSHAPGAKMTVVKQTPSKQKGRRLKLQDYGQR